MREMFSIVVEGGLATGDVNRDGGVNIFDLILVSQQLGRQVPARSAVDLIAVSQAIGGAAAAPIVTPLPPLVECKRNPDLSEKILIQTITSSNIAANYPNRPNPQKHPPPTNTAQT